MEKANKKIEKLNIQHQKEASVYDQARAWKDIAPITEISVKDMKLSKNKTLMLDLAVGTGRVSEYFKNKVKVIVGLDISEDMIKVAQEKKRIDVGIIAPAEKTPFPDNTFDLIYCRSALHYMDQKKAIKEWIRVARSDAWIIISDVSFDSDTINCWYEKVLKCLMPEMNLVYHKKIVNYFKKNSQNKTDYRTFMVRGSLNDVFKRKHINKKRTRKIKKMFETAPEAIKKEMNISKVGKDYEFDFGVTITRCNIKK
jgi:ubiquinone/menaquinone biosynthesis C-methylase UbiE